MHQLRAFLAAARTGGFSRAGISLGLTQPTISTTIRKLEAELGERLFERLGRRIKLTIAGQALFDASEPLLQQWERLRDAVGDSLGRDLVGPVRIGVGVFTVSCLLPRVFKAWRKRYPKARVIVRAQSLEETIGMLRTGDLDLGWRSVPSVPPDLFFKPLATFDRVLISAHSHPITRTRTITLEGLAAYAFVNPRAQSTTWRDVESAFQTAHLPYHVALEGGGLEVIKRYVALGLGLAVVPGCCIEPRDRAQLAVRSVRHLFGEHTYGVLVRRGRPLSRAARELVRLIDPRFPMDIP
jgi:DNA-binding transcriptional LysR family regulator